MADPKWSWRYRIAMGRINSDQMRALHDFCSEKFGNDRSRYDFSFVRRRINPRSWFPSYYYSRVKVHFKHEEDLFLFKLCYSFSEV